MQTQKSATQRRGREQERSAIRRVPDGTFRPDVRESGDPCRESERPALVMLLAPVLGLGIWVAILFLLVGWML